MMRILKHRQVFSIRQVVLLSCLLFAAGCGSEYQELERWIDENMERSGPPVEPLRPISNAEVVDYPGILKDPFRDFYASDGALEEEGDFAEEGRVRLPPEVEWELNTRKREELEQFELDTLRMIGSMEDSERRWGLVQDPQGSVHRVEVENYLGRNIGKIISIGDDRIQIRELLIGPQGRLEEREAKIALRSE